MNDSCGHNSHVVTTTIIVLLLFTLTGLMYSRLPISKAMQQIAPQ